MKFKSIGLVIILFVSSNLLQAQLFIGLSGGLTLTKFYTPESNVQYAIGNSQYGYKFLTRIGYSSFSVPVLYKLNNHISFQSGLSYLDIGSRLKLNADHLSVRDLDDPTYIYLANNNGILYSENIQYLSIPLTIKYSVSVSGLDFYGRGGAYVSYALGGKYNNNDFGSYQDYITGAGSYQRISTGVDTKVNFSANGARRFDTGLLLGGGCQKQLKKGYVFLEAMYMLGLYNVNTLNPFYTKTYNRGVTLSVGYMFAFGK